MAERRPYATTSAIYTVETKGPDHNVTERGRYYQREPAMNAALHYRDSVDVSWVRVRAWVREIASGQIIHPTLVDQWYRGSDG